MSVVITYRSANGEYNTWVTDEDKLDHILEICQEKNLEVEEIDYVF
jgi:hypothetical protein